MPTNYINQSLNISENQKEKIYLAIKNKEPVTIRVDDAGDDIIALTETQINKINKAFQKGKSVNITLSKAQLKYNKNHIEGGFLPLLMGLARTAAPAIARKILPTVAKSLGIGGLTALGSLGMNKILGKGMYVKKGGNLYKIKTQGEGLYLTQKQSQPKELQNVAEGLYLRDNNQYFDGSGVIHEITKEIPLLNLLF